MAEGNRYVGSELELFALATNWKAYIRSELGAFVRGRVLEVGAGIGETTRSLISGHEDSWTCLEPDGNLAQHITASLGNKPFSQNLVPEVIVGKIDHPACGPEFNTILYIDVLEHIAKDELEIQKAVQKLTKNGILIVLAPAHQFLFTSFDHTIGHYRRYSKHQLKQISPPQIRLLRVRYLDSAGCLASLGNKYMLKAGIPSRNQILFWDKILVPLSRLLDPLFGHKIGKSIYMVGQKN